MLDLTALSTPVSGGAFLTVALIQLRLFLRDRGDRKFARYVFDQTRSTTALRGYAELVEKRRRLVASLNRDNRPPSG